MACGFSMNQIDADIDTYRIFLRTDSTVDQHANCVFSHRCSFGMHCRQRGRTVSADWEIVEANDGSVFWYREAMSVQGMDQADRDGIRYGKECRRPKIPMIDNLIG